MLLIEAKVFMEKWELLPQCEHGNNLIDWGFEPLVPPCGCRLTPAEPDQAILAQFSDEQIYSEAFHRRYEFEELAIETRLLLSHHNNGLQPAERFEELVNE